MEEGEVTKPMEVEVVEAEEHISVPLLSLKVNKYPLESGMEELHQHLEEIQALALT